MRGMIISGKLGYYFCWHNLFVRFALSILDASCQPKAIGQRPRYYFFPYLCAPMKISHLAITVFTFVLLLATGCRSDFERIRTSGDPALLLEKANFYYQAEEYSKAQTLYELVIGPFRGTQEAEKIAFNYAYTYYHTEQFILASYYFKNFSGTYGGSNLKEEADFMSAYSNYRLSPIFRLDQSYSEKAIDAFGEFAQMYPNSDRVEQSNRLIDEMRAKLELKDFESAKLYYDLRRYPSAIRSFDNLLIEYPETRRAEEIRYLIVDSAYESARGSFVELQEERYEEAVKRANLFIKRYPESSKLEDIRTELELSNKRLKELQDGRYQSTSSRAGS